LKVHVFYLRGEGKKKPSLYAVTPEKKHAKIFEHQRNMDKFIHKVIKNEDMDEDMFLRHYSDKILNPCKLEAVINRNLDNQDVKYVEVMSTESELDFMMENCDGGYILNRISDYEPIDIFTKEVQADLRYIKYDKAGECAMIMRSAEGELPDREVGIYESGEAFFDIGMRFDQFGVFMLLYQKYMSLNFFVEIEYVNEE